MPVPLRQPKPKPPRQRRRPVRAAPAVAAADATAVRQPPLAAGVPRLAEQRPSDLGMLLEALSTRTLPLLTKTAAALVPLLNETTLPFPVGGGEWTHKTPLERLLFELELNRQEAQGRMFNEAIRHYYAQRHAAALLPGVLAAGGGSD